MDDKVKTFPQTDLGSAAQAVVSNLDARRIIKWPPPRPNDWPQGVLWTPPKISQPGIYDMPIELYHDPELCDGPSVSASGLIKVEQQSLLHYWDAYVNPEREPFEPSDPMILGSAVHHLVLGQEGFDKKFIIRPEENEDGDPWHGNKKWCKAWLAQAALSGKRIIKGEMVAKIRGIAERLKQHPQIRDGLLSGLIEQSLIVKDKETGLYLKSRPDVLALSETVITDVKVVADASDDGCNRMMSDREYNFQLGFGGIVYEQLFRRTPGNNDYVLVLCESSRPFPVTVRPMDISAIGYGRMMARRALRKLANAYASDKWPAYDNDLQTLRLPPWREKQLENDVKGGLLLEADAA